MSEVVGAYRLAWRRSIALLVLLELGLIVAYADTAMAMVEIWWRSGTFNHAFLVPPISLWLIWRRRHALASLPPTFAPVMLLPLALSGLLWLLGALTAVNAAMQFAFIGQIVLTVSAIIGLEATRRILFPLAFLFFAVPFGEFVMPTLMEWTATFTVLGLRASGIPVYREGLHFVIPSGRWSVVEACSGVRYLIASIVVGTLFAYLNYHSLRRRILFVLIAMIVPLVANWLRAYMIVMIGHFSDNTLAVGVDHLIYGWFFFGIVMLLTFAIGLRWREEERSSEDMAAQIAPRAIVQRRTSSWAMPFLPVLALAPLGIYHFLSERETSPPLALVPEALALGGWQIANTPLADWRPAFENPLARYAATYVKDGRQVGLALLWYEGQGPQRKIISSVNTLAKSSDKQWGQSGGTVRQVEGLGEVKVYRLASLDRMLGAQSLRLVVWQWYWINGRFLANDIQGKLWLAYDRLLGRGDASAALFLYAREADGEQTLGDFIRTTSDALRQQLEQMAQGRH